jgi:endoglucanase
MVYHKTHDYKWTALATLPSQDVGPDGKTKLIRIVKPVTYAATLNLAATGAQGYRVWKDIDSARAEKYLAAAEKAYKAAKALYDAGATTDPTTSDGASLYAPLDQSVGGGPYGDTEVSDDFYWAACELYAATGDSTYKTDASKYEDAWQVVTRLNGGENNGSISSFNWGCTASLGSISLALNTLDTVDQDIVDTAKSSTVKAAQEYINLENSQGYGIPYTGCDYTDGDTQIIDGYEWGSNSFVVNNAIVMAYAYEFTGDGDYVDGVTTAMDYILGTNPNEISYVTGYGTFALKYPHHRYWSNLLDPTFPLAPAGVLSGGPNSAMQDPYIKGMGYQVNTMAPQKCFIDHIEAWSTNECTINWNSPLAWNVSFMEDYSNAPVGDGVLDDYVSGQTDVVSPDDDYQSSNTTSLKVDKTTVEVGVGETETVKATSGTVSSWESADTSVATVDSNGTITGKGEGTTTVTAKDSDGNTVKISVKVTADTTTPATTTTDADTTTSATDSTTTAGDVDSNNVWGDANCDGEVLANDLLLLKKHTLGIAELTGQGLANCDVTHDGEILANDLTKLKKFILGIYTQDVLAESGI